MVEEQVSMLAERRKAERLATLSACCGATGDVTLTNSAMIILFAATMGASDMLSMLTTSLLPLFNGLCIVPMAWLAIRLGNKRIIVTLSSLSIVAYLLIVLSPFFGGAAVPVLIAMMVMFALFHAGYVAGWFPLLDSFLAPERRSAYLSRMRFSWQISSAGFLFVVGALIGKNPPLWKLQLALLSGALAFSGRALAISRIPAFPAERAESPRFREGLQLALANKPLAGYSVYMFVLNLAAYGTLPLVTLHLKRALHAPDNVTVIISAITLVGMLIGSLCAAKIIGRWGIKTTLLVTHAMYAVINLALFLIGTGTPFTYLMVGVLVFLYSFVFANASIASTSEMMALATPGNKTMAMAFFGVFYYTGSGLSRLMTSIVLGSGILAPEWRLGSVTFCHFQSLFLIYAGAVAFAAMLLVVVPAVFPKGEYLYDGH
jgi:MFS family permease